jgi:hypothetical protein
MMITVLEAPPLHGDLAEDRHDEQDAGAFDDYAQEFRHIFILSPSG